MKKVYNMYEQNKKYSTVMKNSRNMKGSSLGRRNKVSNRNLYLFYEIKFSISSGKEGKYKIHIFIDLKPIYIIDSLKKYIISTCFKSIDIKEKNIWQK